MNRLRFFIARQMRDERALESLSVPQQEVLDDVVGRRVALVGNARGLANATHGAAIDAAEVVIRINRAPMPGALSHGTRTDMLALATSLDREELERIHPRRILWMSHKRKRLSCATARSPGFYLHPLTDYAALQDRLSAPPTTGAMMIDLLARSRAARIDLYGFDFFATLSLSGHRTADRLPHDFATEAAWVHDLIAQDSRFVLHPHG
ncbi:glycosyltransferase family 29 protein [Falsirhodobacter sp. 20TX0035]|uniref:glycosyltransferase family 29 protein n=1 Tax=Falsirhodobacter sp. 20TX0035 TaxID=3022019 RepID=UPI00232D7CAF|nr:glycosyltransferase family 29 protein [Falsirhodobacter sp. 20TX0035]MDB6453984.1 glycosyltransferase family 29 protein [Falsirhodobacter sp. 20TX0035]